MFSYKITYIEKRYLGHINSSEIYEVKNRMPKSVKQQDNLEGFRYFDRKIIIKDNKKYIGPYENYSSWIYFGKRCSINDLIISNAIKLLDKLFLIKVILKQNYEYACFTDAKTFVLMNYNDITFEEYINKDDNYLERRKRI